MKFPFIFTGFLPQILYDTGKYLRENIIESFICRLVWFDFACNVFMSCGCVFIWFGFSYGLCIHMHQIIVLLQLELVGLILFLLLTLTGCVFRWLSSSPGFVFICGVLLNCWHLPAVSLNRADLSCGETNV